MNEQREKDIQEVCSQIKEMQVLPEKGDCGYTQCPLCYGSGPWDGEIEEISHELNCAYLIAKDLSTKL